MTNDGTQDPVPPPTLADPLSGLVTGGRYEQEPLQVRVVEPPMPDITAVREAMAGMLDDDSELDLGLVSRVTGRAEPAIPAQATAADAASSAETAADSGTPAADDAQATDPTPTPPIGVPAQQKPARPAAHAKVITPGTVEAPRRLPLSWPRLSRERLPRPASAAGRKSSAPSVAAIILLLLVIGVIAIVLIASLIDTFASIFS